MEKKDSQDKTRMSEEWVFQRIWDKKKKRKKRQTYSTHQWELGTFMAGKLGSCML